MPKSLQSLATGPILENYDGPDFKVRYIDNGTNVQITWNNGEERTYSVIPKPQNLRTCKLEQMMDCGEGHTEPHSTYLNIHAKMRHDTNAVTDGQAVLFSQFEEDELDTILTSVLASYAYLYRFPGNWVGREILRRICRNKRDTLANKQGRKKAKRRVHKCRCSGKPAPGSGSNSGGGNEFQGEVDEPQGGANGDDAATSVPIFPSSPSPPPTSTNSDTELVEPVDSDVALNENEEDIWGAAIVEDESQGWDEEEEGDKDENNDADDEDENSKELSNDRTEPGSGWDSDVSTTLSSRSMQLGSKSIAQLDPLLHGTPKVKTAPTMSAPAKSAPVKPAPTNSNPNKSTAAKPVPVPTKPISAKAIIPSAGLAPPKLSRPSSNLKLRNPSIPSGSLTLIPSVSKRRAQDPPVSHPAPKQKKAKISAPSVDMSRRDSRANGLDQDPQKLQVIAANKKARRQPSDGPLSAPDTVWSIKWDRRPDARPISAPKRSRLAVGDPSVVRGAVPPVTARPTEAEMQNSDGSKGHCDKSGDMILVAESMSWICGSR